MALPATKTGLPPMMLRYLEYKERYPDALLFFQVGDFYELFYDDAVTVSKALNLTLTSRDKNSPDPIPMCGVPLSVLDGYVDRLLPLGFSVAVVSQTGSGQGVDRALERFVTPGMRLFNSVSSDATESLIAAVVLDPDSRSASLVCTDPQTGVVRVRDGVETAAIGRDLASWMVREVILPRISNGDKVDRRTAWVRGIELTVPHHAIHYRAEPGSSTETERLLAESARSEFHALGPSSKRATRLLMTYLDEISLGNPLTIREVVLDRGQGSVVIDAATRRNLELVHNAKDGSVHGTLYGFLNTTQTPAGSRLLKSWIVTPLAVRAPIEERQAAVAQLRKQHAEVSALLSGVSDLERLAARIQLHVASPKDLAAVRDTLERIPMVQDLLAHLSAPALVSLVDRLHCPFELRQLLTNALVDSPPHTVHDGGIFRDGFDQELDQIRSLRSNADAWRAAFEAEERRQTGIGSLKVRSNNVIGYFLEIPSAHSSKAPQHYVRRQSTANADRFTTPELKKHEDEVITAVDRQVRREQALFTNLRQRVAEYVEVLRSLSGALATIDALAALARAAETHQWTAPLLVDEPVLSIRRGRHPIVEELLGGSFIPNSVTFGTPDPTCHIVTGPNMGGKSTYLRQTALITVLAQIGSFVPAEAATVGLVDRIFARLGAADDLHEGESTFMVEMREAAHILANATPQALVLIDELGRGTATTDGQSLAQAILEHLAFDVGCRTLFATHYHDITALASVSPRIRNLSVGSIEEEDRVVFTHAIQEGPAPRSYGLEVAKLSGLPRSVLVRAGEILTQLASAQPQQGPRVENRQASLFAAPAEIYRDPALERLRNRIKSLDVDGLSAREALHELYQLKEQALKDSV